MDGWKNIEFHNPQSRQSMQHHAWEQRTDQESRAIWTAAKQGAAEPGKAIGEMLPQIPPVYQ